MLNLLSIPVLCAIIQYYEHISNMIRSSRGSDKV